MIRVKCIKGYYDTKLNRSVAEGEEFEITDDRANQLVKAKVAEVTTPTTEKVVEPVKKTRKKKEA